LNEPIELFLDCWKKSFSLKTLGGGYVRFFMLFTRSGLLRIETSHVSNTFPTDIFTLPTFMGRGEIESHLFWGAIFAIAEHLLGEKRRKEEETLREIKRIITVGKFIEALNEIKKRLKIRKTEVKGLVPYALIKLVEISREEKTRLKLVIHAGKKETYEAILENENEREKAITTIQNLVGYHKVVVKG